MKTIKTVAFALLFMTILVVSKNLKEGHQKKKPESFKDKQEKISCPFKIIFLTKNGSVEKTLNISQKEAKEFTKFFKIENFVKGDTVVRYITGNDTCYFPYRQEYFCLQ
jgi:hypothetical protein